MVLPTVFLILAISIGAISAQIEKVKLLTVAGMLSRALARAEPIESLQGLFASQLKGRNWQVSNQEAFVCVEVSRTIAPAGLPEFELRLAEEQCARKLGL